MNLELERVTGRVDELRAEPTALEIETIDEENLRDALAQFDPRWEALTVAERDSRRFARKEALPCRVFTTSPDSASTERGGHPDRPQTNRWLTPSALSDAGGC